MAEQLKQTDRRVYLCVLYTRTIGGDREAAEELSKIALGGSRLAGNLVRQMDARLTKVK